jgi:hypothetical protein
MSDSSHSKTFSHFHNTPYPNLSAFVGFPLQTRQATRLQLWKICDDWQLQILTLTMQGLLRV